jgi:hypothetical protein
MKTLLLDWAATLVSYFLLGLIRILTGSQAAGGAARPKPSSASTLPTTKAMPTW